MASAERKKGTPGRKKKASNQQFFDVGKVGRKTGITLEDKGVRDEHGLEPMEHIFSSPVSPQRRGASSALRSSDTQMQESSGPDVDYTLTWRKTPRLPPPRASTPKHTNIGSPKRGSTGRPITHRFPGEEGGRGSPFRADGPPANRVLDFGTESVRTSIEGPFKPRHTLRRSTGQGRTDNFESPKPEAGSEHMSSEVLNEVVADDEDGDVDGNLETHQLVHDDYIMPGDDDDIPPQTEPEEEVNLAERHSETMRRQSGRSRKSSDSASMSLIEHTAPTSIRKRNRGSLEDDHTEGSNASQAQAGPAQKKQRGGKDVVVLQDDSNDAIDPSLLVQEDENLADDAGDSSIRPAPSPKGKTKGKKSKVPKERDPNRAMQAPTSPVKLNDSPSKLRNARSGSRGGSVGPVSNVNLRSATPFEDAGERISRYGRALIKPLKYWANEARIYNRGECASIVRADEVEQSRPKKASKRSRKKGKPSEKGGLEDIEEESDTESIMPDEWEDSVGVIAGMVASWDPETEMGNTEDLVKEDLAFASSSIVTRDVAGSQFKYAKITTTPFGGSGVVEIPPEGYKRVKNSRKMQMCFFVHEGKVLVEISPAGSEEMNAFSISKGGVWVVPRGNNYAISNESRTKTARVFFGQSCVVSESREE